MFQFKKLCNNFVGTYVGNKCNLYSIFHLQRKSTIHSISGKENIVCILLENYDFGVVGWEKGELACCCCYTGISSKCLHVNILANIMEGDDEKPDFVYVFLETRFNVGPSKSTWFLKSKSYMPIPFKLPARLNKIMFEKAECHVPMYDEGICFIPNIPNCNSIYEKCDLCGSAWTCLEIMIGICARN